MRLQRHLALGSTAGETKLGLFALLAVASVLGSVDLAAGLELTPPNAISLPDFDYARLGDISLCGDFDGISRLDYAGQAQMLEEPSSDSDDLIVQYGSGVFVKQPFANGRISTSCTLGDNKTVVIAGNFTSVFNQSVENSIAAVNFENQTVLKMGTTTSPNKNSVVNGSQINTLWCNGTEVYAGGSFEFNGSTGVAVWNQQNNSWALPGFGGFTADSSIYSIIPYNGNILFGGNFSGLAPMSSLNATGNSSNLLKPGMQPVSFNLANATGFLNEDPSTGTNASSLLCPSSQSDSPGWVAGQGLTTGYVNVTLAYTSQPTAIRLFNLADGSGTKTFRIISEPAGSFMNLTYSDDQGNTQSCAAYCPLPEYNDTVRYTDFKFVNVVPTTSLRVELLDFYGTSAGLNGIQLFESGQYAFAYNAFNSPRQCGDVNGAASGQTTAASELHGSSPWSLVQDFMTNNITDKSKFQSTYAQFSLVFDSYAVSTGHYEVFLYTPGCSASGTCAHRGQVNVSVYPGFGTPQYTSLYQTNEELKYDLLYNGTLQKGAYVRITPSAENSVPLNFVAYKLSLNYLGRPEKYNASTLFEYSKSNFTLDGDTDKSNAEPVGKTVINSIGKRFGDNSTVKSLLLNGTENLIIGGSGLAFNDTTFSSSSLLSLQLKSSDITGVTGLDGEVSKLYNLNGSVFALSSRDAYNVTNTRTAEAANIGAAADVIPFSFNGSQYWAFSPVDDTNTTLTLLDSASNRVASNISVKGHLSDAYLGGPTNNVTIYTGSLQLAESVVPDVAVLSDEAGAPSAPAFTLKSANLSPSSKTKRQAVQPVSNLRGSVYGGAYLNSSHSVLVGHFNATTSDNETTANALIVDDSHSSQIFTAGYDIPANSSLYTAVSINNTVAIGGDFTGKLNGTNVQGLLFYPNQGQQPAMLNSKDSVAVYSLAVKPNTTELLVGGNYSASSRTSNASCNGLCVYSFGNEAKWYTPPNLELSDGSIVNDLVFVTGDQAVIGGEFSAKGSTSKVQVATYNFTTNALSTLPTLEGAVSSLMVVSNSTEEAPVYVVSGRSAKNRSESFISWYHEQDKEWNTIPNNPIQPGSNISTISTVILNENGKAGNATYPFNSSHALLVSGSLILPQGPASVVVYDGRSWSAMYGTTSASEHGHVRWAFSQYGGDLKGGALYAEATKAEHRHRKHEGGHMPVGHVVGIACAIGICCVLVLMLGYLSIEYILNNVNRGQAYQNLSQTGPNTDRMAGTKTIK